MARSYCNSTDAIGTTTCSALSVLPMQWFTGAANACVCVDKLPVYYCMRTCAVHHVWHSTSFFLLTQSTFSPLTGVTCLSCLGADIGEKTCKRKCKAGVFVWLLRLPHKRVRPMLWRGNPYWNAWCWMPAFPSVGAELPYLHTWGRASLPLINVTGNMITKGKQWWVVVLP